PPTAGEAASADPSEIPVRTPFFGWRVVWLTALTQALGIGLMALVGVLIPALEAEFGASRATLALGVSIFSLTMIFYGLVLGPRLDRGRIRPIMLSGLALATLALLGLSRAAELWQLAALLVLVSVGAARYGPLPAHVLIVNWFSALRGRAMALATLGLSVTGFSLPPLGAWLIGRMGWRDALAVLGLGAAAILVPLIWAFAVKRPEDIGQFPDGRSGAPTSEPPSRRVPHGVLLRNPNFWWIGAGFGLVMGAMIASALHLVPHGRDLGLSLQRAALAQMSMSSAALIGKLVAGWLADRVGLRFAVVSMLCVHAAGWAGLSQAQELPFLMAAAAAVGFGGGGMTTLPALYLAACFGRAVIGQVGGLNALASMPFMVIGPPLLGWVYDRTGGYEPAFYGLIGTTAVALTLLALVRFPAREPDLGGGPVPEGPSVP
ncbi:MAG: MFS transporter, partial [Proteobacteria bacterium]|nr:MFS transporter [Pseudomonadota bacterium]